MLDTEFVLNHYAGGVLYDTRGFREKNKDVLFDNLADLMRASSDAYVRDVLFGASAAGSPGKAQKRKVSQGGQFRAQLDGLMRTLYATTPHYIRCIKSNGLKKPDIFDPPLCLAQLRYAGVFEAVTIRKQGFPFRYTHENFFKRYRVIVPEVAQTFGWSGGTGDWKAMSKAVLDAMSGDAPMLRQCRYGRTMVLYRALQHRSLELRRELALAQAVLNLQRLVRGITARVFAMRLRAARGDVAAAAHDRDLDALAEATARGARLQGNYRLSPPPPEFAWVVQARALKAVLEEERRVAALLQRVVDEAWDPMARYEDMTRLLADADALGMQAKRYPPLTRVKGERREGAVAHGGREAAQPSASPRPTASRSTPRCRRSPRCAPSSATSARTRSTRPRPCWPASRARRPSSSGWTARSRRARPGRCAATWAPSC